MILNGPDTRESRSVLAKPRDWYTQLNTTPPWHDHITLQRKIKKLPVAADFVARNFGRGGQCPVIDDELAYEGKGDGWREADVIESHLGAFIGGGYGTTGHKPASKKGHYFHGDFHASEHKAADNLKWFRAQIDGNITFWKMHPAEDNDRKDLKAAIFAGIHPDFRAMQWAGREYLLATNRPKDQVRAELPAGKWQVRRYELMNMDILEITAATQGRFIFDAPDSRAVLFHFKRTGD